jgi:hypothetical protein
MARRWLPVWDIACVGASLAAACGGSASERSTAGDGQSTALGRATRFGADRIDLRSPDMDGRKDPVSRDTRLRLSQRGRGPLRSGRHRGARRQQRATGLRRDCYACREPGVLVARSLAPCADRCAAGAQERRDADVHPNVGRFGRPREPATPAAEEYRWYSSWPCVQDVSLKSEGHQSALAPRRGAQGQRFETRGASRFARWVSLPLLWRHMPQRARRP